LQTLRQVRPVPAGIGDEYFRVPRTTHGIREFITLSWSPPK
jgi:hypothetical protein